MRLVGRLTDPRIGGSVPRFTTTTHVFPPRGVFGGIRRLAPLLVFLALAAPASAKLPPLPHGWPTTLQLGMADSPGGAAALCARPRRSASATSTSPGGVNTGSGLVDLEPGRLVRHAATTRSRGRAGDDPGASATTSSSSRSRDVSGGEQADRPRAPATTRRRWARTGSDVRLLLRAGARARRPVVLHVEPDLWGYIEQRSKGDDASTVPAVVPDGLPQNAAGFAQEFVRLRNELAPNVDPRLPHERLGNEARHRLREAARRDRARLRGAARPPSTARSHAQLRRRLRGLLRPGRRLLREAVEGNPNTWFKPADFARHLLYAQTFVPLAGHPDGRLADPARKHRHAGREQHLGPLPGQPRAVAPRPGLPSAPARLRRGGLRRLPVRAAAPTARRRRRRTAATSSPGPARTTSKARSSCRNHSSLPGSHGVCGSSRLEGVTAMNWLLRRRPSPATVIADRSRSSSHSGERATPPSCCRRTASARRS